MATDTPVANCNLNEEQFNLRFPSNEAPQTYGLVGSDAEWRELRNDPNMLVKGMPPGIGNVVRIGRRGAVNDTITMWDGTEIEMWSFEDENGDWSFPAKPVRLSGGDLLQCDFSTSKRVHTIHWHGIEPDMDNDGVGHTSFEVSSNYTYQWRAHPANAGTYFYHCHVNTTLHVQMGMFGPLIIDPYEGENPPERKLPFGDAPESWRYHPDNERIWALYSLDPSWHELAHDAGLCGEDVGLNNFDPAYFLINGDSQVNGQDMDASHPPIEAQSVTAQRGENVLLRLINATYFPVDIDLGDLPAELIETDGRALRARIDLEGLGVGTPIALPAGSYPTRIGSAERFALLVRDAEPGTYPITFTYRHWISKEPVGVARTFVRIT